MPHASTGAVDVFGGTGLEDALLSRLNISTILSGRVLRGAGQALGYRLVVIGAERRLEAVYGAVGALS